MRNKFVEEMFEAWDYGVHDNCYDDKQAQYDYDGCAPADEDEADWFKPKFKGGIRIG